MTTQQNSTTSLPTDAEAIARIEREPLRERLVEDVDATIAGDDSLLTWQEADSGVEWFAYSGVAREYAPFVYHITKQADGKGYVLGGSGEIVPEKVTRRTLYAAMLHAEITERKHLAAEKAKSRSDEPLPERLVGDVVGAGNFEAAMGKLATVAASYWERRAIALRQERDELLEALIVLRNERVIAETIHHSRNPDEAFAAEVPQYAADCASTKTAADIADAAIRKATTGATHANTREHK